MTSSRYATIRPTPTTKIRAKKRQVTEEIIDIMLKKTGIIPTWRRDSDLVLPCVIFRPPAHHPPIVPNAHSNQNARKGKIFNKENKSFTEDVNCN